MVNIQMVEPCHPNTYKDRQENLTPISKGLKWGISLAACGMPCHAMPYPPIASTICLALIKIFVLPFWQGGAIWVRFQSQSPNRWVSLRWLRDFWRQGSLSRFLFVMGEGDLGRSKGVEHTCVDNSAHFLTFICPQFKANPKLRR